MLHYLLQLEKNNIISWKLFTFDKMKKIYTLILLALFPNLYSFKAQTIKLADLIQLCGKSNWEEVNYTIKSKGWEYFSSTKGNSEQYNEVTWSYKRNDYNQDEAKGWITLYTYDDLPSKVTYEVFNKESFALIENAIKSSGFKLINSEILNDEVKAEYANSNYTLELKYVSINTYDSDRYDYSYNSPNTRYLITVTRKGSIYDPENGNKSVWDEETNTTFYYTLKEGEIHGESKQVNLDGAIINTMNWNMGKRQGKTKYFSTDNGLLLSEETYKNDTLDGPFVSYFPNGNVSSKGSNLRSFRHGVYIEYDEKANITLEANYINGIKDGPSKEVVFLDELGINGTIWSTYSNDQLNGKILVISSINDTVINGNYKQDKKHGNFKYYKNGILEENATYSNGKLNGKKTNYITEGKYKGQIWKEGNYIENDQNGEHIFNFNEIFDEQENAYGYLPVSGKETFRYGRLEGLSSLIIGGKIIYQGNYKDDEKSGDWTESVEGNYWEENNVTLTLQGKYMNGKKEGNWKGFIGNALYVDSYHSKGLKNGDWVFYSKDGSISSKHTWKTGKKQSVHFYENNEISSSLILVNENNSSIEVDYKQFYIGGLSVSVRYKIDNTYSFDDIKFLDFFETMTHSFSQLDLNMQLFKSGEYQLVSLSKKVNGQHENNQKHGNWTTTYIQEGITVTEKYHNGTFLSEFYTNTDNIAFSGTLEYVENDAAISIKIKKGLRNGLTMMKDSTGKIILKQKYKDGILN